MNKHLYSFAFQLRVGVLQVQFFSSPIHHLQFAKNKTFLMSFIKKRIQLLYVKIVMYFPSKTDIH